MEGYTASLYGKLGLSSSSTLLVISDPQEQLDVSKSSNT